MDLRFFCQTCPYIHVVKEPVRADVPARATVARSHLYSPALVVALQMVKTMKLATKDVDDVLGGAKAWENVDQTDGAGAAHAPVSTPWALV